MRRFMLIVLCLTFFLFLGIPAANGTIVAPGSTVEGKTIGEWTADWWIWAIAQSMPNDAFTDATGANAAIGQTGPLFFIAGTTGGTATRSFTVLGDKFLLVPLVNYAAAESSFVVPPTVAELSMIVDTVIDGVDSLFAEIDGTAIPESDLFTHRESSPVFSFVGAPNNPFYQSPGPSGSAVADGYWLMLNPLGEGTHTIRFGGGMSDGAFPGFLTDVTDTINAVPEPSTILLLGVGLAGVGMLRRKSKNQRQ